MKKLARLAKCKTTVALTLAAFSQFTAGVAHAQAAPPNAGSLLDTVRPPQAPPPRAAPQVLPEQPREALRLPADVKFTVTRLSVSGNKAVPTADIEPILASASGREISLRDLEGIAQRITELYRSRGFALSRAYIPQQDIRGGTAEISVIEGWLERVEISNQSRVDQAVIARFMQPVRTGEILSESELERALLLLNDLPATEVRSTLKAGTRPGASIMELRASGDRRLASSVELDNSGSKGTGVTRAGLSSNWISPLGQGDLLNVRLQLSEGLRYGRLGYQLPVGAYGTRANLSASRLNYKLIGQFSALNASGHADTLTAGLTHPLIRARTANLNAQVQYEDRSTRDLTGSTGTDVRKTARNWTASLDGNFIDALGGGGYNSGSLGAVRGRLGMDAVTAAIDAASARSAGGFSKLTYSAQRVQSLPGSFELWFSHNGQTTGENLDSSEKFSLSGVHAYPQGEASGDIGHLSVAELRWRPTQAWELGAAYESGSVTINHSPWVAGNNSRHLAGVALSATFAMDGWRARIVSAWKAGTGTPTSAADKSPRIWLQLSKSF